MHATLHLPLRFVAQCVRATSRRSLAAQRANSTETLSALERGRVCVPIERKSREQGRAGAHFHCVRSNGCVRLKVDECCRCLLE